MTVAILTIGSELLDGRVRDTNSQYMNEIISAKGISITAILSCDDDISEIHKALDFLFQRSNTVIISGGLGPTADDLTREAVATYFNQPLEINEKEVEVLKELYKKRSRVMDESNIQQAFFPKNSKIIPNIHGTAAGFFVEDSNLNKAVATLPGVPKELKAMFESDVLSWILSRHKDSKPYTRSSLRTFGLPESLVGSIVKGLNLDKDIIVSYRANFPEIQVILKGPKDLKNETDLIVKSLGEDFVFTREFDSSLPKTVHGLLMNSGKSISVAESCTGGLIGKLLSEYPGASSYFKGGVIAYDNSVKHQVLGVLESTLEKYGAVSRETVIEMAENARKLFHSSIGISVSGIAGPDGGSPAKPVGTFFIGLSSENIATSYKFFFSSSRDFIRTFSAYKGLDVIRRLLLGARPPSDAIPD